MSETLTISRVRNYNILVKVDSNLINPTRVKYPVDLLTNSELTLQINQFMLIYAIGSIQSRRFNPSNRQKFTDKEDLIEKIKNDKDFKVQIDKIRNLLGSETLGKISEDFGVGIAVLVADYLYDIDLTTLHRITEHGKRPDIKCMTRNGDELVVESKGYSNLNNLRGQLSNAQIQKRSIVSDIHAVSLTLLSQDSISTNEFIDPPSQPNEKDKELVLKIQRAKHYSAIFSFIGQSELSKYFSYMKNRLEDTEDLNILNKKENLYWKIKKNYREYRIEGEIYKGTLERLNDEKLIFLGIDQNLLTYEGFYNFQEYPSDFEHYQNGKDFFYIYRDGICAGELFIDDFKEDINKIHHFQKRTRISDVDDMNIISFEKFIEFLFIENGYEVQNFKQHYEVGFDFKISKNNKSYKVEIKHLSHKNKRRKSYYNDKSAADILITNGTIEKSVISERNNPIIIDRAYLQDICKKNSLLERVIR
ncbi:restriction endonuclease [Alkalihalobacillus sp. TS-13]|uniref:restriction endonuclease n=1 Tax=Alkalihalobacillus sp. TS-13 TaxID=2842455 RepID=UPI001C87F5C2|nr:restriction endonuclease [Alkalihalobacillus sp. TS-13]